MVQIFTMAFVLSDNSSVLKGATVLPDFLIFAFQLYSAIITLALLIEFISKGRSSEIIKSNYKRIIVKWTLIWLLFIFLPLLYTELLNIKYPPHVLLFRYLFMK